MRFGSPLAVAVMALFLVACSKSSESSYDVTLRTITLPHGQVIRAEVASTTTDILRGLAFRTSIPPDRGMLFFHPELGNYSYWMYQHMMPLDIVQMNGDHQIVDIVENVQPCKTQASRCEHYGGLKLSKYDLEMGAGMVRKYGLAVGQKLEF